MLPLFFCACFVYIYRTQQDAVVGRVAQSVKRLTTVWTFRDRIPLGMRFSAPVQTVPGTHTAFCKMSTWSFPGVMPMEIFVSCVGDLAILGGSVGRGLGPATPLVRFLFFFPQGVGGWKVLLWQLPCAVTELSF